MLLLAGILGRGALDVGCGVSGTLLLAGILGRGALDGRPMETYAGTVYLSPMCLTAIASK